ncbi:hypothetical protein CHISP_1943 [Chitinispirillum alkaliphilum]|nr:hypothetical protein CHISP_1943 [Chitinispirillum alkaliphilum]
MNHPDILEILPLALYAETHFRFFRGFPSFLYSKEPEIIFDMPRRLEPNRDLPLILIVNDFHLFPIQPVKVSVSISAKNAPPYLLEIGKPDPYEVDHPLKEQCKTWCITISRKHLPQGEVQINARLDYRKIRKGTVSKRVFTVLNDNLRTTSKLPYRCFISDTHLPGKPFCTYGDLHCHSQFSRSHVEFGPPVQIIDSVAASCGTDFVAITDHSYDLVCDKDNYLKQDQGLSMWKCYRDTLSLKKFSAIMIPGEEISCLNSRGEVVHLNALSIEEFIPGTKDGARSNRFFDKQLTINQAVKEIHKQGGYSFAAHPGANCSALQRLLLHRGTWNLDDLKSGVEGVQALNSGFFGSWQRGKNLWIKMLQRGYRMPILAGNDAHGDFNRYRCTGKPFLKVYEDPQRYMGYALTGIYGTCHNSSEVINALRMGKTFVTNGPFATLSRSLSIEDSLISSTPLPKPPQTIYALALSTQEIGPIQHIRVICGTLGGEEETVILEKRYPAKSYDIQEIIPKDRLPQNCYLRLETEGTKENGLPLKAATSACYLGNYKG